MKNLVQQDADILRVTVPATYASGDILFSAQPSANSVITLGGVDWTFVSGASSTNETQIKADLNATLDQLVTDLNASANATIASATYSNAPTTATTLRITFDTAGASGNAFTLEADAGSNGVPSAATLLGGGGVLSGEGLVIGSLFGVAAWDALSTESVEIVTRGVVRLPKTPSAALAAGAFCWWEPTHHEVVPATGTGFICIGVAVKAAAATDRTVNVLLQIRPAAGV